MTAQYYYGQYPGWDDNSLSKPSVNMFNGNYQTSTMGTTVSNPIILSLTYSNATIQLSSQIYPSSSNLYFRISLDDTNPSWLYFFEDSITFENLSEQDNTATISLRLDFWGTCMGALARQNNSLQNGNTQVLAVNKEVNLYDYWEYGFTNESSYMGLKNIYPQFQKIQPIKYQATQLIIPDQQNNTNNDGGKDSNSGYYYYYAKIIYLTTSFHTYNSAKNIVELHGNIHDMYTTTVQAKDSSDYGISSNLPLNFTKSGDYLPYVAFSPVVPMTATYPYQNPNFYAEYTYTQDATGNSNCANAISSGMGQGILNYGYKGTLPLLLSGSTDKDVGLVQLPFDVAKYSKYQMNEDTATGNLLLTYNMGYGINDNVNTGSGPLGMNIFVGPSAYGSHLNDQESGGGCPQDYFISPNGVEVGNLNQPENNNAYWGTGYNGGCGWGGCQANANDNGIYGNLGLWGFQTVLDNVRGLDGQSYLMGLPTLMCPMLFSFVSQHVAYMGQEIHYDRTYCNNILDLVQPYYSSYPGVSPSIANSSSRGSLSAHSLRFVANYPNLTLNGYTGDNIKGSTTTPIGQINLSTAMLPNTTNPNASYLTNEHKIINNASTLKNLDQAKTALNGLGGLGLNSILDPFSLITSGINMGLNEQALNLQFSNSFGSAKQYELGHSNVLQTAGDNLGAPDNELITYGLVPPVNEIQNIMGMVDKYGYPYNQGDTFSNLFANYYHNYIKLGQNADYLVYENAPLLIKEYQSYLIKQFQNGVVIWEHGFGTNNYIGFFNGYQYAQDMMNGAGNFYMPSSYDDHYHLNFKANYQTNTLLRVPPSLITKPGTPKTTTWNNTTGNKTDNTVNRHGTITNKNSTVNTPPKPKLLPNIHKLTYTQDGNYVEDGDGMGVGVIDRSSSGSINSISAGCEVGQYNDGEDSGQIVGFVNGYYTGTDNNEFLGQATEGGEIDLLQTNSIETSAGQQSKTAYGQQDDYVLDLANFELPLGTIFGSGTGTNPPKLFLSGTEAQTWYSQNVNSKAPNSSAVVITHPKEQNPTNQKETPKNKTRKVVL